MIRYTVKPDRATENEQFVDAILQELDAAEPAGLRYTVLRLADGVTYVHLIDHSADAGPLPGGQLGSLRAFHAGLRDRCVEHPERVEVSLLGEFGAG